jgi:hypothetical protein
MIAGNLRSHRRNQFIVLHSRWTGSSASQAAQATIKMTNYRRCEFDFTPIQGIHRVYPSPWRIHLRPQDAITGASRKTKPAMHTSIYELWFRWMLGVEGWGLHEVMSGGRGDWECGQCREMTNNLSAINSQLPTFNYLTTHFHNG